MICISRTDSCKSCKIHDLATGFQAVSPKPRTARVAFESENFKKVKHVSPITNLIVVTYSSKEVN